MTSPFFRSMLTVVFLFTYTLVGAQVIPVRSDKVMGRQSREASYTIHQKGLSELGIDVRNAETDSIDITAFFPSKDIPVFFPVRDTADAKIYFGSSSLSLLRNLNISLATDMFSIYTEFASDYVQLFGSLVRVSFGGLLASADTSGRQDSSKSAVQRFLGAGGNALLTLAAPIYYHRGESSWGFDVILEPKFAADLPAVNAELKEATSSVDTGLDILLFVPSVSNVFRFYFQSRLSWVAGSADFYNNLGVDGPFSFGKLYIGVDISDSFRVSVTKALFGPRNILDKSPLQLGVQLIPFN